MTHSEKYLPLSSYSLSPQITQGTQLTTNLGTNIRDRNAISARCKIVSDEDYFP